MLNKSQEEAVEKFTDFLHSNEKSFLITGGPGYGKSYLVKHLVEDTIPRWAKTNKIIDPNFIEPTVYLTATSNSAVDSLNQLGLLNDAETIHRYLGLYVHKGKLLKRGNNSFKDSHVVIFIDEYSWIDNQLYKYIKDRFDENTCKIVYIGDRDQLRAVQGMASKLINHPIGAELTIQQRNPNPLVKSMVDKFKKLVHGEYIDSIDIDGNLIDMISEDEFNRRIANSSIDYSSTRVIAATNQRVVEINDAIRSALGMPDHYMKGEQVFNNSFVSGSRGTISTDSELQIIDYLGMREVQHWVHGNVFGVLHAYTAKRPNGSNKLFTILDSKGDRSYNEVAYAEDALICDLRPGFASTVYKAQGKTYDTVYVDLGSFLPSTSLGVLSRSLYVSASRATNKIIFVGELHPTLVDKIFT